MVAAVRDRSEIPAYTGAKLLVDEPSGVGRFALGRRTPADGLRASAHAVGDFLGLGAGRAGTAVVETEHLIPRNAFEHGGQVVEIKFRQLDRPGVVFRLARLLPRSEIGKFDSFRRIPEIAFTRRGVLRVRPRRAAVDVHQFAARLSHRLRHPPPRHALGLLRVGRAQQRQELFEIRRRLVRQNPRVPAHRVLRRIFPDDPAHEVDRLFHAGGALAVAPAPDRHQFFKIAVRIAVEFGGHEIVQREERLVAVVRLVVDAGDAEIAEKPHVRSDRVYADVDTAAEIVIPHFDMLREFRPFTQQLIAAAVERMLERELAVALGIEIAKPDHHV